MSGFSAEWLALREPVDVAARSVAVTEAVLASVASCAPLRGVDLGCGTGSNVRYLTQLISAPQQWRLLDHDPVLLAAARASLGATVDTQVTDLRVLDASLFAGADLVTASALLDLVSEEWLVRFVDACRRAGAAVLVALNYDGRMTCAPHDEDDEYVRDLVNRHQRTDKGFGPALGPDSAHRAAVLLSAAGYDVTGAKSDWQIGSDRPELQRQLIRGWASAAIELSASDADRIRAWESRRLAAVDAGSSHIMVGHDDVGATLGIANR